MKTLNQNRALNLVVSKLGKDAKDFWFESNMDNVVRFTSNDVCYRVEIANGRVWVDVAEKGMLGNDSRARAMKSLLEAS